MTSPYCSGAVDRGRASPKEAAIRARHTSISFIISRYGHLFPKSDAVPCELFVPAMEHRRTTTCKGNRFVHRRA